MRIQVMSDSETIKTEASGLRVLVAEPDQDVREVLVEALVDEGFRARAAANADDAVLELQARSFDAVIVHLGLYKARIRQTPHSKPHTAARRKPQSFSM